MSPRLDMIGMVVGDMATSLAFYRRLGLDIPPGADGEQHVETSLPGGLRLGWDTEETIRSIDPAWQPPAGGHRIALAFRCADPATVDQEYEGLVAAGYQGATPPFDAVWGQRYATVHDPDGNAVDLFAPLTG
jgi:catechol 2,3-dioxygenase-like lactoylglutathione lyase family enzyme